MKLTTESYQTGAEILHAPNKYEAFPATVDNTSALVTTVDGRKVVKAGTIYPANDATARGVVLRDVDVTDSAQNVTVIYEGTVNVSKLPAAPAAEAKKVLPRITWFEKAAEVNNPAA